MQEPDAYFLAIMALGVYAVGILSGIGIAALVKFTF